MTITVFGATGQVGKYIIAQGLALGFFVKAFGRNIDKLIDKDLDTKNFEAIKGYVFDEDDVLKALQGSDAVISVLGGGFDGLDKTRSLGMKNILTQMNKANVKRIVALGGLGVLNAEDDTLLIDSSDYPEEYKPVGLEHLAAYHLLQQSNANYTFVCSPNIIDAAPTGKYITSATYAPKPNNYKINAGDLAHFMLQEVQTNEYTNQKVGISNL